MTPTLVFWRMFTEQCKEARRSPGFSGAGDIEKNALFGQKLFYSVWSSFG